MKTEDAPVLEVAVVELTEEEIDALAQAEEEERRAREQELEDLATSIESKFNDRAKRRSAKESQWLRSARLYYGKLSTKNYTTTGETPWNHRNSVDRPDINIVRSKCSIAIAQTVSMQFGTSNKNWDIFPDKADKSIENVHACTLMADTIESQLETSKYSFHCRRAIWDRVILGTAVMKGPLSIGEMTRSYTQLEGTDTWVPSVTVDNRPIIQHINPWFFYPDESTENVSCLEDAIEVHPMSGLQLKKYKSHPGFDSDAISIVLETKPQEYRSDSWSDFAELSENNPHLYKNKYVVLEYHGPITRDKLDKLGVCPTYESSNDEYYGEVWVCQGQVLRLELSSIEASYEIPYYMCVWEKDPASVFGYGVPLMMEDAQRVVNESWHMILDNSSLSSGPQVAMQRDLVEPANGKWELAPGQLWYLTDPQASVGQAIQFFNTPNVTGNIVPILQMAQNFAEEESCIPLISAGLTSPEVGDTATGQLMMRTASTTLLDFMSEDWDDNITAKIIANWYAWNMQYNSDPAVKGAFAIDVRTSTEYKNKQLHLRDLEKLSVEAAQNPEVAKHLDLGQLARMRIEMMNLPSKSVILSPEQVRANEEAAAANAQPNYDMMKLQLDARRMDLDEAKLEFEMQQNQQREIMEHEERMAAARARLVESEARVAVSQNEKEIALIELAQRDKEHSDKLLTQHEISRENNHTKVFLKSLEESRKQQEADSYQNEIDLAATKGSGI